MTPIHLAGATAAALLAASAAHAASPFDGTWRTDMSSIAFSKKPEIHMLKDGMGACTTCTPPWSVKADGAFHPVSGHPEMDALMIKVIDARTVEETDRKDGRDVSFSHVVASPDGQHVTVDWKDMTNPNAPVATGHGVLNRVGAIPAGAHPTSGAFVPASMQASKEATMQTLKLMGGVLSMSTPTGQGYSARVDGPAAPYKGDPAVTTVKITRAGPRELVEMDMQGGKAVSELHMTVSPDGKTLTLSGHSLKSDRRTSAKAMKV